MLDIELGLLVFVAVLFLALIYLLNNMLYQPLLAFMDQREGTIKKDLESTKQLGADVDDALTNANAIISDAKLEAASIREAATTKAKDQASDLVEAAKSKLETEYNGFVEKLAKERTELKDTISSKLPAYQDSIQAKLKQLS